MPREELVRKTEHVKRTIISLIQASECLGKQSIASSTLQGYKQKKAFIIAQGPLQSTVRNFWKMIYDRKCAVVVMTSGLVEEGHESSAQYWPSYGTRQYGEYAVNLIGEERMEGFTIRNLSVMDTKVC